MIRRYYEAPAPYEPRPGDRPVFLGGGITGVEDWQARATARLLAVPDVVVLNPRRKHFPIDDPAAAPEQIAWEHRHLHLPGVVTLFWFGCETLQPIALFELGAALDNARREISVGAHPDYPRRSDIEIQASLARPGLVVHDDLDATVTAAVGLSQPQGGAMSDWDERLKKAAEDAAEASRKQAEAAARAPAEDEKKQGEPR